MVKSLFPHFYASKTIGQLIILDEAKKVGVGYILAKPFLQKACSNVRLRAWKTNAVKYVQYPTVTNKAYPVQKQIHLRRILRPPKLHAQQYSQSLPLEPLYTY